MARVHERHPVELHAIDFSNATDRRTIRNISAGGVFVECARPLPAGAETALAIALPSGEIVLARAAVAHPEPGGMGLAFRELPERDRAVLQQYLDALV